MKKRKAKTEMLIDLKKRTYTMAEIEEAIEAAKEMVIDASIDATTKIAQMGGYIRRHLIETPPKKKQETEKLYHDRDWGLLESHGRGR